MSVQQRLLALLADGTLHSGSELADALGITRSAIWKQIRQLEALGISVSAQAGQGYQLAAPLELFIPEHIQRVLAASELPVELELLWESPSTSSHLLAQPAPSPGKARACIAEYQSAGRGRRGRQWIAPVGEAISLSVAWRFAESPANLSCLGLAVGVAALRAVHAAGLPEVQLKWPNDLVLAGRKLAGILIDVQGEAGGPLHVVAGVGVNYQLSPETAAAIASSGGIAAAGMLQKGTQTAGRNQTAALLIVEIVRVFQQFSIDGFTSLLDDWLAADYLAGREVDVVGDRGTVTGVARGIAADGRLRLESNGQEQLLLSGDVSVRATA